MFIKTNLKTILNNKTKYYSYLRNNYFLIVITLVLFFLLLNYIIFLALIIIWLGLLFSKSKYLFTASLILIALFSIIYFFIEKNYYLLTGDEVSGKVITVDKLDNYDKIVIQKGIYKVIIYDYKQHGIKVGNLIEVHGRQLDITHARVEYGFDYKDYLKREKVISVIQANEIIITSHVLSLYKVREVIYDYLQKMFIPEVSAFLKTMLLANDIGISDDFKNALKINGITHLFAVSGLHITLMISMISKLLKKFRIKENIGHSIIISILTIYIIITLFTPSIMRVFIAYLGSYINKKHNWRLSSLDIQSLSFIILILINPYNIYKVGFILSFLVAFLIIIIAPLLKNKAPLLQLLIISICANIVTLPIIINLNNDINLLAPFTNLIFIYLINYIILPLSFLCVLFFPFQYLLFYLIRIFTFLNTLMSNIFVINLTFGYLPIGYFIGYYCGLLFLIRFFYVKRYRYIIAVVLACLVFVVSWKGNIVNYQEINFLDLANGEAIIILDDKNECRAIIDTGDGTNNEVSRYLKNKGIKKVNYLFLTHAHDDHNGEADRIINDIVVNNIVVSAYDNSVFKGYPNTIIVKKNDSIICGQLEFLVLHPDMNYSDINDNSIVLYSKIGWHTFLFTGDITKNVEDKINVAGVDVLKVAHHGSKTSTSDAFLKRMRPQYAIIQTGRVVRFGFPHSETITTLEKNAVTIYRTDRDFSIKYKFDNKKGIFLNLR